MKIPQHIKIGNLWYKVEDLDDEDDRAFGRSNQRHQWIKLSKNIQDDRKFQAFFEESNHQVVNKSEFFKKRQGERLIDCLSSGMFKVLKDNGFLVKDD